MNERSSVERELHRLIVPPPAGENAQGLGTVRVVAFCTGNSAEVLARVKELLIIIDRAPAFWNENQAWLEILPDWFVAASAPEMTLSEAMDALAQFRAMSLDDQIRREETRRWSLSSSVDLLKPANRKWYWWDGIAEALDTIYITLEIDEWPVATGVVSWILRAAGADEVFCLDD